jgi:hypothetical protein
MNYEELKLRTKIFFKGDTTWPLWVELMTSEWFDGPNPIDLNEISALLEQLAADDSGLGINPHSQWDDPIPSIPTWHFWRSY